MVRSLRAQPGGIAGLRALVDEHSGAVEADLRHYYQADVQDLFTGRLTARQVIAWINQLPAGCALDRAQHGDDALWDLHAQLLAAGVDVSMWANYQRAGGKGPKPQPIPRPGVKDTRRRVGKTNLPADEAREVLNRYRTGGYATEGGDDGD